MRKWRSFLVFFLAFVSPAATQSTISNVSGFEDAVVQVFNKVFLVEIETVPEAAILTGVFAVFYYTEKNLVYGALKQVEEKMNQDRKTSLMGDDYPVGYNGLALAIAFVTVQGFAFVIGLWGTMIMGTIGFLIILSSHFGLLNETMDMGSQNEGSTTDRSGGSRDRARKDIEEVKREQEEVEEVEEDVEEKEESAEESIEEGEKDEAEKQAETGLKELEKVSNLLQDESEKIEEVLEIEEEELENAFSRHEEILETEQSIRQEIKDLDRKISEILFESISRTWKGPEYEETYQQLAEKLGKNPSQLEEEIDNFKIVGSPDLEKLEKQLEQIEQKIPEEIKAEELNFEEIEKVVEENKEAVREFRKLKKELEAAVSEEKELKTILEKLDDEEIWEKNGKELEEDIVEAKKNYREAEEIEKKIREIENSLSNLKAGEQDISLFKEMEQMVETRRKTLQIIEKRLETQKSSATGWEAEGKEWRSLLDNPNNFYDGRTNLSSYDKGKWFSEPSNFNHDPFPYQGFKIHVSAYPGEGFEVAKALIPILQNVGAHHKIMHSKQFHKSRVEHEGRDGLQVKKFMTIYPPVQDITQVFEKIQEGTVSKENQSALYLNEQRTLDILHRIKANVPENILKGGPQIEGERKINGLKFNPLETRISDTRLHIRYAVCNSRVKDKVEIRTGQGQVKLSNYVKGQDAFRSKFLSFYVDKQVISETQRQNILQKVMKGGWSPLMGVDGHVAGAYYLPPPETWSRLNELLNKI